MEDGKEVLQIEIFDKDDFGKDESEGYFELSLEEFRDQQQHDMWFDLEDK